MRRFNHRLESILGSQRIPRAEKQAKAEETMRAVDELMAEIETGLSVPPKND
jgi:cell division septum initiation protein DivIVA